MTLEDGASEGSITPRPSTSGPRSEVNVDERTLAEEAQAPVPLHVHPPDIEKASAPKPALHWTKLEVYEIPRNNMPLVLSGLMLTMFLAALDQTIAAIALPTIVSEIGGEDAYSWVGSAYLLTSACLIPVYGKLSDIFGRKPILYISIFLFLLGSALCGAAKNFVWLAASRGLQGIGGGGVETLVIIVMSDITLPKERGLYGGLISATWGVASVLGPLVGGLLTQHVSWRWCFWINLPTGGIAALILIFSLKLNPVKKRFLRDIVKYFDFLGLFLSVAGIVLLLLGFQFAGSSKGGWHAPQTLATLVIGAALFILAVASGFFTRRDAIIPPKLLQKRTTAAVLVTCFLHTLTVFAASYYVPLYFQILGSSATMAGLKQLPLSLGSSLSAIIVGLIIAKTKNYRMVIWTGWAIMAVGYGLMIMLNQNTPVWEQEVFLTVTGVGIGCLFQPPLTALQAAMPVEYIATGTATFMFIRTLGGAVGVSVGNTIFTTQLNQRLASLPQYSPTAASAGGLSAGYTGLSQIQPDTLRDQVLTAYTSSLDTIWIVFVPISIIGLLCALLLRAYPLDRNVKYIGKESLDAIEGGTSAPTDGLNRVDTTPAAVLMNAEATRKSIKEASKQEKQFPKESSVAT